MIKTVKKFSAVTSMFFLTAIVPSIEAISSPNLRRSSVGNSPVEADITNKKGDVETSITNKKEAVETDITNKKEDVETSITNKKGDVEASITTKEGDVEQTLRWGHQGRVDTRRAEAAGEESIEQGVLNEETVGEKSVEEKKLKN